jgi:hypothetical protein
MAMAGGVVMMNSNVIVGPGGTSVSYTTTGPAPPVAGNPWSGIHPVAAILSLITSVLGLGLAIYLLVIGVLTLRYSPDGAKLHWRYVWMKIPLVVVATAAGIWVAAGMVRSITASMPPGAMPVPMTLMMSISTIMGALFSLAYPIGLIAVLRSRTVREYYGSIRD